MNLESLLAGIGVGLLIGSALMHWCLEPILKDWYKRRL